MKAIIVDDEQLMLKKFERIASYFYDLMIVGKFESADDAIAFAENEIVDVAFIDIDMPVKNGIELARELREIRSDIIIVFVTAYDEYITDSNQIGGDYYLMKPYSRETFSIMMEKIRILASRQ
ncbi:MAG: response regulator, partial [Anaerovoracaceae bacterium]|nr:response regulator [Anaerovoracaceae bacterium]